MRTPNKQEQVYDGYGFRTNSVALMVESYLHDPDQDQERTRVWEKILIDLSKSTQNHKEVEELLREEVRKGIPEKLRPLVWPKLIVEPLKQYESISVKEELKEIDRDINRTIPTNKREAELKDKLKHMLNVVAVAFPEMGYCQGLNFITANLLLILDEKHTYDTMYHILYWQGHGKLMSDLERIHVKLYILNSTLCRLHRADQQALPAAGQVAAQA